MQRKEHIMLSIRKMLMCANGACDFQVNQDSAYGGYCCKLCHFGHALESCPPQHGPMCQRLPARTGAVRAEPRPPDRQLSTNKKKIQRRKTRAASDFATGSTARVKATPPDNKRPELRMSNSLPNTDFARVSGASGSASHGSQVSQQTGVTHMPEEDANPDEEQETHRIDMAAWLKPPDPWILVYDFELCLPYYHNITTRESQWTLPTESWEER